ncbi:hypothetical protein BSKO_05560 [Bryopsis sp. KO-2023]|nr:hypothetical protein BSKO_05560 [Bryopsis sp. KO-2023]
MVQERTLGTSIGNEIESVEDTAQILKAAADRIEKMTISDSANPVLKSSSKENFSPLDRAASCRSSYSHGLPQKSNQRSPSFMQPTASWRGKEAKERKQGGGSRSKPKWVSGFVEKKKNEKVISLLNETVYDAMPQPETFDCDVPRYMRPTKTRMSKLRRSESFARSKLSKTPWQRSATPEHPEPFSEVTNAHQHRA